MGDEPPAPLTEREQQVLDGVTQGHTNKEIARTLNLSHRTIEIYRASLMHKMGAHNVASLVRKALSRDDA
jgi:two-component system response regulator FixJ